MATTKTPQEIIDEGLDKIRKGITLQQSKGLAGRFATELDKAEKRISGNSSKADRTTLASKTTELVMKPTIHESDVNAFLGTVAEVLSKENILQDPPKQKREKKPKPESGF